MPTPTRRSLMAPDRPDAHTMVVRPSRFAGRRPGPAGAAARSAVHPWIRWGLYAFMFSIPFEYPDRTIPLEVHTITALLFVMVALIQTRVCFRRPCASCWWLAAYLWGYASLGLFSAHLGETAKLFLNYAIVACLFWIETNLLRRERLARGALWSFVLGCSVVATLNVLGIGTKVVESDDTTRRIVFGQDANLLGGNMALALVALMTLTFGARTRLLQWRVVGAIALAFVLAKSLMLAGSRGAVLAVAGGVLAFGLQTRDLRAFAKTFFVTAMVAASLLVVVYRSDSMMKPYTRTLQSGNMSGREQIFPEAWKMFAERPLLGWGPIENQYELGLRTAGFNIGRHNADGVSDRDAKDTHNLMLDVLTSMGILGGLPLFICIGTCAWGAWRARATIRGTAPLALVVVVLMLSMDANWSASKQGWAMMAFAAASGSCASMQRRRRRRPVLLQPSTVPPAFRQAV